MVTLRAAGGAGPGLAARREWGPSLFRAVPERLARASLLSPSDGRRSSDSTLTTTSGSAAGSLRPGVGPGLSAGEHVGGALTVGRVGAAVSGQQHIHGEAAQRLQADGLVAAGAVGGCRWVARRSSRLQQHGDVAVDGGCRWLGGLELYGDLVPRPRQSRRLRDARIGHDHAQPVELVPQVRRAARYLSTTRRHQAYHITRSDPPAATNRRRRRGRPPGARGAAAAAGG